MTKRKAQLVYAPPAKRDKSEHTYSSVKGAIQRGVDFEFAAARGAKSKYRGLWCLGKRWDGPTLWAVPVETPQGVKPPPVDVLQGPTPGFENREPYFIARGIRSEVEAALLRDVATLWLRLHQKGCTPTKLAAVKWNLPCMELWKEESGVVKPLQRVPPGDRDKAQKTIRRLASELLPSLPKRLIPDYTVHLLKRQKERQVAAKKQLAEWEANKRKMEKAAAAQRKAEAAQAKAAEAARLKAEAQRRKEVARKAAQAAWEREAAAKASNKARSARAAGRARKRS